MKKTLHFALHNPTPFKQARLSESKCKYTALALIMILSILALPFNGYAQFSPVWETAPFKGGQNSYESSAAQVVDSKGNLIIFGHNSSAWHSNNILYSSYEDWQNSAGYHSDTKITLFKYDAEGNLLWTKSNLTGSASDTPIKLLLDAADNILVSGTASDDGSFIIKYTPDGQQLWRLNGSNLGDTEIRDFAVGTDGSVVMTGSSNGYMSTQKISPQGVPLWEARFFGSDGKGAKAYTVALDNAGNVYTATKLTVNNPCQCGQMGWDDITLVKYNGADGSLLFSKDYQFPKVESSMSSGFSDFKYPSQILPTPLGNVYLVANQYDGMYGYQTIIFKLNSNGTLLWSKAANDSNITTHKMASLAENESLVLLCRENTYRDFDDFMLTKFDKYGQKLWLKYFNIKESGSLLRRYLPKGLSVTGSGLISVTGSTDAIIAYNSFPPVTEEVEKNTSIVTVYDHSGQLLWSKKGLIQADDLFYGLGLNLSDEVLFTVSGTRSSSDSKLIATKYALGSDAAVEAWVSQTHRYNQEQERIEVDWTLHTSAPQPGITKYNVYHTSATGTVQSWTWDMPADETSVGATYFYNLREIGMTENLVFGLSAGTGYDIPNTPTRPKEVQVNVAEATGGNQSTITTGAIAAATLCAGSGVSVPFTTTGIFDAGNTFTAQLSDASGSFANAVAIGSGSSSPITATIPGSTAAGSGYRIRVVASSPAISGSNNNTDITINAIPNAPRVTELIDYCQGSNASALTATGSNLRWYSMPSGGAALPQAPIPNTATTGTTEYFVSQTVGGCESPRARIAVRVGAIPAAPAVVSADRCGAGSVTLTASGGAEGNYRWYTTQTGGTAISGAFSSSFTTPALSSTTTYYVSVVGETGCESQRIAVTATVNEAPVVSAGNNENVCLNSASITLTGFSPAGGTWSGTGVTANGVFNPTAAGAGSHTLTYTVTQSGCIATATKVITVGTAPTASLAAFGEVCSNVTDLPLTGGQPAGGTYSGPGVINGVFNASAAGVGTHTITYTYTSGGCTALATQSITVSTCTGTEAAGEAPGFVVYPNPATAIVTIEADIEQGQEATLRVYDATGKVVYDRLVKGDKDGLRHSMNLKGKAKGLYLLYLETEKGKLSRRILLE